MKFWDAGSVHWIIPPNAFLSEPQDVTYLKIEYAKTELKPKGDVYKRGRDLRKPCENKSRGLSCTVKNQGRVGAARSLHEPRVGGPANTLALDGSRTMREYISVI